MYTSKNFKTKKQLKLEIEEWNEWTKVLEENKGDIEKTLNQTNWNIPRRPITLFAPGLGSPKRDGWETVEGPHFPEPHKWYAEVFMENGIVTKVK